MNYNNQYKNQYKMMIMRLQNLLMVQFKRKKNKEY